jgi:hypothetical protein
MKKYFLGMKIDWGMSLRIGIPVSIGWFGLTEVFALYPGVTTINSPDAILASYKTSATVVEEGEYFATLISARAGEQSTQKDSFVQVGHSAVIFEKAEKVWDLKSQKFIPKLGKGKLTPISTKGGQLGGFWKTKDDDALIVKYEKAKELGVSTYDGASMITKAISKEKYDKYRPESDGGKVSNYLGFAGCYIYTLVPMSSDKSWFCNCSTASNRLFYLLTGVKFESKYPTSVAQAIDKMNNEKNWFMGEKGKFTPIRLK